MENNKRKEWPAYSRFFALGVNQLNLVHEGKKSQEFPVKSFDPLRVQLFLIFEVF